MHPRAAGHLQDPPDPPLQPIDKKVMIFLKIETVGGRVSDPDSVQPEVTADERACSL